MLSRTHQFLRKNLTPIILAISLVIFLGWSLFFSADMHFSRTQLGFTNLFADSMLTLVLIVIYSKIANAQQEQTQETANQVELSEQQSKILQRQEELMEFQYEPHIRITGFEFEEENKINISMMNAGNGFADKIYLRTEIFVRKNRDSLLESTLDDMRFTIDDRDCRIIPGYNPLVRKSNELTRSAHSGGVLKADEGEVEFESRPNLSIQTLNDQGEHGITSLQVGFEKLLERGFERVHLELSVVYCNVDGEEKLESVLGRSVDINNIPVEIKEEITREFITPWSPQSKEELLERVADSAMYPRSRP